MKLYYSPGACSLVQHIVQHETGLPFTMVKVDLGTHRTESGQDYYQINPKGQVPFLELDDGNTLSEGPIIAQYLSDQASAGTLMPKAGTLARYKVMEWQNFITSELHKSFSPLFNSGADAATHQMFSQLLLKKLAWVDDKLTHSKYLTGDNFTAADAYLFVVLGWATFVNLDITSYAHLQRFADAVRARPAVQKALRAEGLLATAA